ncbi:MAG TPA: lysophospholipid transporter LplT, partial [Burkholderiales bacterium]|nr:lysophospholipid transporter LplT [Burkholderiales bacterium]
GGCLLMLFGLHPVYAYALVGLGAAAYSPAKYGILTEYLPHHKLVVANGWIEGLTVASIIIGTVAGGLLINDRISVGLLNLDVPFLNTGVDTAPEAAILIITFFYAIAAAFNLYVPRTGVDHVIPKKNPLYLVHDFGHCLKLLWVDRYGQISLAVTTLFWGAGATLQFIVLKWAEAALGFSLSQASMMQGIVAMGIAAGAVVAAKFIPLSKAVRVLPVGIAMGLVVIAMNFVTEFWLAVPLMVTVGALAGFFVVPMNALLQHRGHILMGAGHSIAVQNFNENLSILVMLLFYALLIWLNLPIQAIIVIFGVFVSGTMLLVRKRHQKNVASGDLPPIPEAHH